MTIQFTLADDFTIEDLSFEGLTGMERVANVREALNVMHIENPAIAFKAAVDRGEYAAWPEEEYAEMLDTICCLASLFHDAGETYATQRLPELNLLILLKNALELVVEQDVALRRYRED